MIICWTSLNEAIQWGTHFSDIFHWIFSFYSHWIHVNLCRIDENFAMQRAHRSAQHPLTHSPVLFLPAVAAALFLISSLSAVSSRDFSIYKSKIRCMWPKSTSYTSGVACIANFIKYCTFSTYRGCIWNWMTLKKKSTVWVRVFLCCFRFLYFFWSDLALFTFVYSIHIIHSLPKLKKRSRQRLINETLFVTFYHSTFVCLRLQMLSFCMTGIAQKSTSFCEVDVGTCSPCTLYLQSRWFCIISLKRNPLKHEQQKHRGICTR